MKHQISFRWVVLSFSFVLMLNACKKNANEEAPSSDYFLKASIKGQNYERNEDVTFNSFQYTNQDGCITGKSYTMSNINQINVSLFSFDLNIFHFENTSSFNGSSTGSYNVYDYLGTPCNLGLVVDLEDESFSSFSQRQCKLQTGSLVNNITKISKVSETSTDMKYNIEGNFSCNFKNFSNVIIPVTGSYRTWILVEK